MMAEGQTSNPASEAVSRMIFHTSSPGEHLITDNNNNVLFKVKPYNTAYHHKLVLVGCNGEILALLKEEFWSCHHRWTAYRGESENSADKLFSIKRSHAIHSKDDLHMSLENKQSGNEDFKIRGSWATRNCSLYKGNRLMAEMERMEDFKDKFMIKLYPNVDSKSVVLVFAIVERISGSSSLEENHHRNQYLGDVANVAQAYEGFAQGLSGIAEFLSFFE